MEIDPSEPWGIALDYAGRGREQVIEQGFAVDVWVADASPGQRDTPTVTAQIVVIHPVDYAVVQLGMVSLPAYSGGQWAPSPVIVQEAVEQCAQQAIGHLEWLATLAPPTGA